MEAKDFTSIPFWKRLFVMTDGRTLAIFRIAFGALMFYEMNYYLGIDLPGVGLAKPKLLFPYDNFDLWSRMSESGFETLFTMMALACVFIMVGFLYRIATVFFFVAYVYFFFLDTGYFNNHFYLFVILGFMMSIIPAHRRWSVDNRLFGKKWKTDLTPYWGLIILRLQLFIVYFYGGIAKLHTDWLVRGEPVRSVFAPMVKNKAVATIANAEWFILFITIGGLLFDLLVGFALWYKPTRKWGILATLFFNITNAYIFDDIGVFPYFMLASTILWFEPWEVSAWLDKTFKKRSAKSQVSAEPQFNSKGKSLIMAGLGLFFAFQLIFPLRPLFLPWDANWTSVGWRFTWRMKLIAKQPIENGWFIVDKDTGKIYPVEVNTFINTFQVKNLYYDPRNAVRFAKWLKEEAIRRGIKNPKITARLKVSYNGREPQYIFDPDTDLAMIDADSSDPESWILPLKDDYRKMDKAGD